MKTHQVIHRVALVALTVVAAASVHGSFTNQALGSMARLTSSIFGLGLWSFLIWKVGMRPRQWGMGMGIFLSLMIAFQIYLFRLALANPAAALRGSLPGWGSFLLFYELPILIAAVSCILLRFLYPLSGSDSAQPA